MDKTLNEIGDKMRECIEELRKNEQEIYTTKRNIEQMLEICLNNEENQNDYDPTVFN